VSNTRSPDPPQSREVRRAWNALRESCEALLDHIESANIPPPPDVLEVVDRTRIVLDTAGAEALGDVAALTEALDAVRAALAVTQTLRTPLPPYLAQQTFQEARSLAVAIADGPALRRWAELTGELALRHAIPDEPHQVKFTAGAQLLNWWGRPSSYDMLRTELRELGLPAVLLLHVVVGLALETHEVTTTLDDLMRAIGWQPRSSAERVQKRQRLWRWLLVYDSLAVIGQRPGVYRDPATRKKLELGSVDALIRITGARAPLQPAFDASAPPADVTFVAGPWLNAWRGNHRILTHFGDIRRLAALPAGKAGGAWAQSIGLALHQRWRERAARAEVIPVGEDRHLTTRVGTFTRHDLLNLLRAEPDFEAVLASDKPHRAKHYWDEAIKLLQGADVGLIGHYAELEAAPAGRKGWQAAWLAQPLDIRPKGSDTVAVASIASQAKTVRRRMAPRKARASQASR
jgi:hypothetical protein